MTTNWIIWMSFTGNVKPLRLRHVDHCNPMAVRGYVLRLLGASYHEVQIRTCLKRIRGILLDQGLSQQELRQNVISEYFDLQGKDSL